MGGALLLQHNAGERELPPQGLPWRAGGPAMLRVLILALLWRRSLAQPPGFTLTVPHWVSVQEGLCVLVPCTFTYPASYDNDNPSAQLYGAWYKEPATVGQDPPVAGSATSLGVSQEAQGRFRLTGDPARGDCSLQISDARRTDAGRYFFSFDKGLLEHTYRSNSDGTDPVLTISLPALTEEPEIQISPSRGLPGTLLAGEPVTVTCTAPGRCSGPPPRVTWTGLFSDTARDVSAQLPNGTWAHSSVLSFTPGPRDHGKELVCSVTYRPPRGPSTNRTVRLHVGWSLSQLPGFTLTVPQSVSVQEGLCVLIPCTFTYPASYDTDNPSAQLYGHWYKEPATVGQDHPVASSVSSSSDSFWVSQETQGRFRLTGDLVHGDCSLQISDARQTDAGRYFFSIEKGLFEHTYRPKSNGADSALTISVPGLTEEPEIQISPARGLPGMLLAGELVTVTCTAPGRCSGPPPRVTWTGPFSDTARDVSAQLPNGTWAHSSALSFTPGPGDHGKELVCNVTYRPPQGPSTRRTVRLHVSYSPGPPSITGTLTRNGRPVPDAWGAEGDVVSLETQEGDSLSLSCEVGSRTDATLSWAKGNESLSSSQGGGGRMELSNLSRGDAGEYRCWAKNSYGSASRALRVHVQYSPRPGTVLTSSCQRQGPNVSCSCSLRSHPPPQLQWQVDGEAVAANGSRGALQVNSWAQGDEAVSTLSWMGDGDGGHQIFCLGSNPHGFHILLLNSLETGHPAAVVEAEGRTGRGSGNPRCPSSACRSGRSSATEEPTRN